VDFGKLFTEKFSLRGVQCQKISSRPRVNTIYSILDLCWSQRKSHGRKGRVDCHLHRADDLGNKMK